MLLPVSLAGLAGYLLGSLPFGVIVARAHGVNIFEVGSKNPGATNVRRSVGKKAGTIVLILDMAKGAVAAALPLLVAMLLRPEGDPSADWSAVAGQTRLFGAGDVGAMQLAGMVGALLGHSFSLFTGFRGGKGVATGAGGYFVLVPIACLIAAVVWVLSFFTTRYVSVASILAACAIPVAAWLLGRPMMFVVLSAIVAAFVVIRHRTNIKRLMNGTESRFTRKPAAGEPGAS